MKFLRGFLLVTFLLAGCHTTSPNEYLIGTWVKPHPTKPKTMQGFILSKKGKATSVNLNSVKYTAWRISDGNLVLSGTDTSAGASVIISDTFIIESLSPNMLILRDSSGNTAYYSRQN